MSKGSRYQKAYEQFLQGEIDLFYKEVYPSLLVFTRRLLPKSLVYLAEDCVQDAIFRLYSQRSGMASSEHAKSFLYICIHNVVVSYIRKDNSRQHFIQQDNDNFEDDFSVELIRQETIDELMGAVNRLPDDMRQLCEMIFREGLKTAEIARQLKMTESGVKKKKRRLLYLLRKSLSPEALFVASMMIYNESCG